MPPHTPFTQLPLAPLGAGDLIDRTVRLYRRHFLALLRASAPPVLVSAAGGVLWMLGVRGISSTGSGAGLAFYFLLAAFAALLVAVGQLLNLVVMGGASRALVRHLLWNEAVTARSIYGAARARFWALLGAALAVTVCVAFAAGAGLVVWYLLLVVLVVGVVVGGVAAGGAGPSAALLWAGAALGAAWVLAASFLALWLFFWLAGRVAYVPQVLLVEGRGVFAAVARSAELARGNTRRLMAMFVFTTFATYSALMLLLIPLGWYGYLHGVNPFALDALKTPDLEAGAEPPAETERRVVEAVRRRLPPRERGEWAGESMEADNAWLHSSLEAYLNASDPDSRAELLTRAAERLAALLNRLEEAAGLSAPAPPRDKDAEKGRLASILRRPEFQPKAVQETALRRLFKRLQEWLRALLPESAPLRPGAAPGATRAAQIIVYALAFVVVAYVLWRFGPALLRRRAKTKPERGARVVLGEVVGPEQMANDLLAEAERAARAGDLRGAIRKAYVALLTELGDRGLLRLARHKTNRDYLEAVRTRAALHREMQPLTEAFERHWYGAEAASETDWAGFRARCRQAMEQ